MSRRSLGHPDAALDQSFASHFVHQPTHNALLSNASDVVYGAKGMGKTALRRALTEIHKSQFFATYTIDLDSIKFEETHTALRRLEATSGSDVMTLSRSIWRNVLALYCLEAVRLRLPEDYPGHGGRLERVLDEEKFLGRQHNARVVNAVERIFERLAESGVERESDVRGGRLFGLPERQRRLIEQFPQSAEIEDLLKFAAQVVQESSKFALICLDGFDSVVDHQPESRKAIFAGLVDAIHRMSRDPVISRAFCFKAFLPKELTSEARAVVWDADKYLANTHALYWGEQDIRNFLAKRLVPLSRAPGRMLGKFEDVWLEFMPESVRNRTHGLEEETFSYILRHTVYRPRQVLFHVQEVLDRWDERSTSFRVDESLIPSVVASSNRKLSEAVVNQLEYAMSGVTLFIRSWAGGASTILFEDCLSKIKRFFSVQQGPHVQEVFGALYEAGVLGIVEDHKRHPERSSRVRFSFVENGFGRGPGPGVKGDDIVALCPMLQEFSGCTPSECGAVLPVRG